MTKRTNNPDGRPPILTDAKRHQIFAADPDWRELKEIGGGNASLAVRILLEAHRAKKPG